MVLAVGAAAAGIGVAVENSEIDFGTAAEIDFGTAEYYFDFAAVVAGFAAAVAGYYFGTAAAVADNVSGKDCLQSFF